MKKNRLYFVMGFVLLIGLIVGCSLDNSMTGSEFSEETTTRKNQINGDITTCVTASGPVPSWLCFSEGRTAAISGDVISRLKIMYNNPSRDIGYTVYIPGIGFDTGYNGEAVGYTWGGISKIRIWVNNIPLSHSITYRVKSRYSNWSDWVKDGIYVKASDYNDISAIEIVYIC